MFEQQSSESAQPKISVIVPFYNVERFIGSLLYSLKNQTLSDFEVLLIDDHSNDKGNEICKKIVSDDNRFKLFSTISYGPSAARNLGLANTKGKYVLFADADDTLEHDTLSELLCSAENNDADFVIGDFSIINNEGRQCRNKCFYDHDMQIDALEILRDYLHKPAGASPMINVWGRLYSAKRIKTYNLRFSENMKTWEDTLFNIDYLNTCPKTFYLSKRVYNYYLHSGVQSGCSAIFSEPDGYKQLIKHICDGYLKNEIPSDELKNECEHFIVYIVVKTIFQCYNFYHMGKKQENVQRKNLRDIISHYINDPQVKCALENYHWQCGESRILPFLLRIRSVALIDWWCWRKTRSNLA